MPRSRDGRVGRVVSRCEIRVPNVMDSVSGVGVLDKAVAVLDGRSRRGARTLAELVEATGLSPGHRPPAGRGARGPRPGAARRRRAASRWACGSSASASRGRGRARLARRPARRWPGCGTRPASRCSSTCATATSGCASSRWSRPTGCARSCPSGARLPLDRGSARAAVLRPGAAAGAPAGWVESVAEREPGVASVSAPVVGPGGPGGRRGQRQRPDRPHHPLPGPPLRRRGGRGRRAASRPPSPEPLSNDLDSQLTWRSRPSQ